MQLQKSLSDIICRDLKKPTASALWRKSETVHGADFKIDLFNFKTEETEERSKISGCAGGG